ncbi:MAG: hypothetical protein IMZ52_01135 [Actinobacteria bacterium]|nr:hypothetical protein [Actinomycetota bacterium]MBE3114742.1 hypothetical protein [Actinomycetota bacterium]
MKKIKYCEDCKYYKEENDGDSSKPCQDWKYWNTCNTQNRDYFDGPIQKIDITSCEQRNKRNECEFYEEKN